MGEIIEEAFQRTVAESRALWPSALRARPGWGGGEIVVWLQGGVA